MPDVLRSAGNPLPPALRADMEARFGADFTRVRVHSGPTASRSAAEIGARAYTSGEQVVLGAGVHDRHTLAHELTHVIQQRQGPVAGTENGSGLRISDPGDRYEQAAEVNARRVLSSPAPPAVQAAQAASSPPAQAGWVQRRVVVDLSPQQHVVFTDKPQPGDQNVYDADDLVNFIEQTVNRSADDLLKEQYARHRDGVDEQIRKWVADSQVSTWANPRSHEHFGRKMQSRTYDDFEDLAKALVGWVRQKPARHEEKEFARDLFRDPQLARDLDSTLTKVRDWLLNHPDYQNPPHSRRDPARLRQELSSGEGQPGPEDHPEFGTYRRWFDVLTQKRPTGFDGDYLDVLQHPDRYEVRDKIIVLHDLYDYVKPTDPRYPDPETSGSGLLPNLPPGFLIRSSQSMQPDGSRLVAGQDRGSSRTIRNEKAPSTIMARRNDIPVYAGQSFTTARMLYLAQQARATLDERNALALGIFAFWRLEYDHTVDLAAHTLHEVLDMAANFGVPYNMKHRQRGAVRYDTAVAGRIRRTLTKLRDQAAPLGEATAQLIAHSKQQNRLTLNKSKPRQFRHHVSHVHNDFVVTVAEAIRQAQDFQDRAANDQNRDFSALAQSIARSLALYQELCAVLQNYGAENVLTEAESEGLRDAAKRVPESVSQ